MKCTGEAKKASILNRFYALRNEIKIFIEMKAKPISELRQDQWMYDL